MKKIFGKLVALFFSIALLPLTVFLITEKKDDGVHLMNQSSGKIFSVSMRDYVIGAVACEMPASFHTEAIKAQAVAVYTNAVREKALKSKYVSKVDIDNYQGYTDKNCLKKLWGKNFDMYYEKLRSAVDSVMGAVITYNQKPIVAAYHSMSNGKTESAKNVWGENVPYLVPVSSEGDTFCSNLKSRQSLETERAKEIIRKNYPEIIFPDNDKYLITDIERSDSQNVLSAVIGNKTVTGQEIRRMFSLRSACFDVSVEDKKIVFNVTGYGHGVGLSQYGADFMARQSKDFKQILLHYYSGCKIMMT